MAAEQSQPVAESGMSPEQKQWLKSYKAYYQPTFAEDVSVLDEVVDEIGPDLLKILSEKSPGWRVEYYHIKLQLESNDELLIAFAQKLRQYEEWDEEWDVEKARELYRDLSHALLQGTPGIKGLASRQRYPGMNSKENSTKDRSLILYGQEKTTSFDKTTERPTQDRMDNGFEMMLFNEDGLGVILEPHTFDGCSRGVDKKRLVSFLSRCDEQEFHIWPNPSWRTIHEDKVAQR
ncbi:hypothetical protein F4778DRAFT_717924 [Xylariomycetidae sp. FL2044]|nr:hypothetical protein F4778DRAFT_717924 [Xylariomycetidae sp. FL2044]